MENMENKGIKMNDFLKAAKTNHKLIGAVIRQFGGWETFKEKAMDVANYGISGGFCGFIYYDETVSFAKKHKKLIIESIQQLADNVGEESFTKLIANSESWKSSGITENELIMALMYPESCDDRTIMLVYSELAWYVGETAAQEYVDFVYNLEN